MTAGPIASEMNSNRLPFHVKRIGHELPRRSICWISCGCVRRELHFVLHDAGRPEQTDDVGLASPVPRPARISGALWPRKPDAATVSNFCQIAPACTSTFVPMPLRLSFRPCQREPQGVVRVAAVVAQHDGRRRGASVTIEIGVAVAVEIAGEHRARVASATAPSRRRARRRP